MITSVNIRAITVITRIWKWLLFYLIFVVAVNVIINYYGLKISLATIISMIGIVLSILMGFRITSAYDRWWEARKIWGSVVNNSRSLARQIITLTHNTTVDDKHLESLVYRHIAFVYAMGSRLRQQDSSELIKPFLYTDEYEQVVRKHNIPNLLLLHNLYAFKRLEKDGVITNFELLRLEETVYQLTDNLGGAERIKNTPFPLPYSYFTSFLVHLFAMMVPFGMVDAFGFITVPITLCVIFIFLVIEQIAIEIQDPFANRENDIPITAISQTIEIDLKEMLGETELPGKETAVDGILM